MLKNAKTMWKNAKTKVMLLSGAAFAAAANAASNFPATDSLKTNLNNLSTDVNTLIGPAAIGLVVAVAMVVVGRGFIRKFFKA